MKGTVYLICDMLTDRFKIGVTKRKVEERLKEIQTGNPGEVFVMQTFESNYPYKLEKMMHRHFNSKKTLNEWFSLDVDDVASFTDICSKYESLIDGLEKYEWF